MTCAFFLHDDDVAMIVSCFVNWCCLRCSFFRHLFTLWCLLLLVHTGRFLGFLAFLALAFQYSVLFFFIHVVSNIKI